jgi:predicted ATPase
MTAILDDRDYSVDAGRRAGGVGRQGELTWVRLRELEKADESTRKWFEQNVGAVLQLSNIQTGRESPTRPRITATLGELKLPLHSYGLGTSQVLPLLVELALALPHEVSKSRFLPRGSTPPKVVVIEEPESHLHPAAQKALAIAIVQFVAKGGKLVLETHSEIILRAIELEVALQHVGREQAVANWVDYRPEGLRGPHTSRVLHFEPEGQLEDDLPPTFDQIVTELVERRLLKGT